MFSSPLFKWSVIMGLITSAVNKYGLSTFTPPILAAVTNNHCNVWPAPWREPTVFITDFCAAIDRQQQSVITQGRHCIGVIAIVINRVITGDQYQQANCPFKYLPGINNNRVTHVNFSTVPVPKSFTAPLTGTILVLS